MYPTHLCILLWGTGRVCLILRTKNKPENTYKLSLIDSWLQYHWVLRTSTTWPHITSWIAQPFPETNMWNNNLTLKMPTRQVCLRHSANHPKPRKFPREFSLHLITKAAPVMRSKEKRFWCFLGFRVSPGWCGSVDWVPACEPGLQ